MCAACEGGSRPPLLTRDAIDAGSGGVTTPNDEDDRILDIAPSEVFGSCSEAKAELKIERPNFYFVLDGSGSMLDPMPGAENMSRHVAARAAIGQMLARVGTRVNIGAATFPRPDDVDACAPGVEVFSLRPSEAPTADYPQGRTVAALEQRLARYNPGGATPTAATLRALRKRLTQANGRTFAFLLTDGAPNCDLDEPCDADRCIPNIEKAAVLGGPACDAETNCCAESLAPHLCLDDDGTVDILERLADAGANTYVIGMPGSETYADILNAMATAAGTAREGDPQYYRVADAASLATTLFELGLELTASCTLDLGAEPNDPQDVRVFADGAELARDEQDGWTWTGTQQLELVGAPCERWQNGETGQLRAFEGCPVVIE